MKDSYDFSTAQPAPVITGAGKTRISIYLDDDVLNAFREQAASQGKGYQTLINAALRDALAPDSRPVTAREMIAIIRAELPRKTRKPSTKPTKELGERIAGLSLKTRKPSTVKHDH